MHRDESVDERSMYGGLAFVLEGHMAVVVSGKGGLMIRTHPYVAEASVASRSVRFSEMRGRKMRGCIRIADAELSTEGNLRKWVEMGAGFAETLPPKQ